MEIEKLFEPKEIPFTKFKNDISAIADDMELSGIPVRVTRHKKPLFMVIPVSIAAAKAQMSLIQRTLFTLNKSEHADLIVNLEAMLESLRLQVGEIANEEDFEKFRQKMIQASESSARMFQQ